jgi:hypothetical protein
MKPLSLADIQAVDDRKIEKVEVPEWNGFVFVRTMNGKEHDQFDAWISGADGKILVDDHLREKVVVSTCCNEQGELLFTRDHLTLFDEKTSAPVRRIYESSCKLNKIRKGDLEEKKGDSETGPIASSQ